MKIVKSDMRKLRDNCTILKVSFCCSVVISNISLQFSTCPGLLCLLSCLSLLLVLSESTELLGPHGASQAPQFLQDMDIMREIGCTNRSWT